MQFYMAPMEGVTTDVFRRAYHHHFKPFDKYFTPFIVPYEKGTFAIKELREIDPRRNAGMNLVPQILTNSAEGFLETTRKLNTFGYEEVNLNLGCPSKTVASKGRGSGFLAFPDELDRFLDQIYSGTDIKISIKTRIGKENPDEFYRLLEIYNQYPVEELIIHPRVQTDYYNHIPNYPMFAFACANTKHSLCYNGDVNSSVNYDEMRKHFPKIQKCMIGRGVVRNPFLLEELEGATIDLSNLECRQRLAGFYYELTDLYREICNTEKNLMYKMKEIWFYIGALFSEEEELLLKIRKAPDFTEMSETVNQIFSKSQ